MNTTNTPGKHHKKIIFVTALLVIVAAGWLFLEPNKASAPKNVTATKTAVNTPERLRLIATGDTIAHDAINQEAKQADGSYIYYPMMENMKPFFDKADVRFCNQAVPGGGAQFGISGYPVFNSPLEVANDLAKLGCNVVNTGTNHTFDKGQPVIDAELNNWDKLTSVKAVAGANRSTAEQQSIRYFTVKGVKFAFLSYSTYSNSKPANSYGLNMYDATTAKAQITTARANADVIIVSMRWGTEYSPTINPQQLAISQNLADWGADLVLGHGTHVMQPVKQLTRATGGTTTVWYSIGNFLNAQEPIESLTGCMVTTDINPKTKKLEEPTCLPIYMHYEWTPAEKAKDDLLARHGFKLYPLDQAAAALAKSQNNTTVGMQTDRLKTILNTYTPVTMLTSKTY